MRGACCEGVHCSCGAGYVWERCRRSNSVLLMRTPNRWYKLCSSGEGGSGFLCLYVCMCGSAYDCGCVVNGSGGMSIIIRTPWNEDTSINRTSNALFVYNMKSLRMVYLMTFRTWYIP